MNKVKCSRKKGITLVELIVVIPIMAIVLSITFAFYNFSNKLYKQSINKNFNQQDVRVVADYIAKELRNAKIVSVDPTDVSAERYKYSLTLDINKNLVRYRYPASAASPLPEIFEKTSKIGAKITNLNFLATRTKIDGADIVPINTGMLEFYVEDSVAGQKAQSYSSNFEIMLDNLRTNTIPLSGPYTIPPPGPYMTIYYAKYTPDP